jgi:3-oxoacyl-[acyl-carrier protein] reductase
VSEPLKGKTAIVTGAARGIGLGIARKLSELGAAVSVWDLRTEIKDANGFQPAELRQVDVSSLKSVEDAFTGTLARFGVIDILVNNAGINGPVLPAWEYPETDWQRVLAIDLNSVFYCSRTVIPHMRERKSGRILNIASMAGKEGVQYIAAYSAAKAGVIGFSKAIAKELAMDNVLVNCIAPAMVETDLLAEMTAEHIRATRAKIPMGRLPQIGEVASLAAWIVGPECTFTTGFVFDLSGGRATY